MPAYYLELLEEGLKARAKKHGFHLQAQALVEPVIEKKEIEEYWAGMGVPPQRFPIAADWMGKWIDGIAYFVAPVNREARYGVRQDMWNNDRVWAAAGKWAMAMPWG